MTDPHRDPPIERPPDLGNSTVAWVIGAVVLAGLLAFVFGAGRDTTKTAGLNEPPGSTSPITRPGAPPAQPPAGTR